MTNSLFEPPFRGVRGNVCTSSIARLKARVDFIFAVIEHISLALTVSGVGQFKRKFQVEGDIAHQPLLVSEN